jgi:hypothetical protein
MSSDSPSQPEDISILLSSFPHLDIATIQYNDDQEQAGETLLAINEELDGEAIIPEVCLNSANCLLRSLS